ncbi:hypothetical protein [Streptomyces sp. NPDC058812]|uniref:hypothetical protein n=1 Tax=unclassified Streptomyces TaxID=2593676 RepID=UPI003682E9E5
MLPEAPGMFERASGRPRASPPGERPTPVQPFRLLVLRADGAGRLGDEETATTALADAAAVPLDADEGEDEGESVRGGLQRLGELRG